MEELYKKYGLPVLTHLDVRTSNNIMLTKSLFHEFRYEGTKNNEPLFTLSEMDNNNCVSMKKIYLDFEDPTDYEPALFLLGSWEHWEKLLGCSWFQPHVEQWRKELEIRMKSKAIRVINDQVSQGGKDGVTAAKYVAESAWEKQKKGRPSKAKIDAAAKQQAHNRTMLEEHAARINLKGLDGNEARH